MSLTTRIQAIKHGKTFKKTTLAACVFV